MAVRNGKCRVSVTLRNEERAALAFISEAVDRPVSYVVSQAVHQFIEKWKAEASEGNKQLSIFNVGGRDQSDK